MLILAVGDTHYNINKQWLAWVAAEAPRYDVVCMPGDFLDQFQASDDDLRRQVDGVLKWFANFPAGPQLFATSGNHDEIDADQIDAEHWLQRARRPGIAVDGDVLTFGGFTFACAGWNAVVPRPAAGRVVLVTHAPPADTDTAVSTDEHNQDFGDFETRQVLDGLHESLVICGHVHRARNWIARVGRKNVVINPGSDCRAAQPNHVVIDTRRGRAEWRRHGHAPVVARI